MHDNTAKALQEAKHNQEFDYLKEIELLSQAIDQERGEIAALLIDRPTAKEYLVGDIETGFKYVPVESKRVVEPVVEPEMIELPHKEPEPGLPWPMHAGG